MQLRLPQIVAFSLLLDLSLQLTGTAFADTPPRTIDLREIGSAKTIDEAEKSRKSRTAVAVEFLAGEPLLYGDYGDRIIARLAHLEYFNDEAKSMRLRSEAFESLTNKVVDALVGTTIDADLDVCELFGKVLDVDLSCAIKVSERHGDYDMLLTAYTLIVQKYWSILPVEVRDHFINVLLTQYGPFDPSYLNYKATLHKVGIPIPVNFPETENHILMIYSARYLANQIRYELTGDPDYNNRINGMTDWMLHHLAHFFRDEFTEYNSRPYQRLVMQALLNLNSFANDPRVKLASGMLLDYISAKVAVSSETVRRAVPYRRTVHQYCPNLVDYCSWKPDSGPDPQVAFYMMLSGVTEALPDNKAHEFYSSPFLWAGLHEYRIPPLIHDLFVNRTHRIFYQRIYHGGVEIYSGSPNFLLSAGGAQSGPAYTVNIPILGTQGKSDDLGMVLPTTLMLARDGNAITELVRFESTMTDTEHGLERVLPNWPTANLGVAPNFACGMAPQIPSRFTSFVNGKACWRSVNHPDGEWTFLKVPGECLTGPESNVCYVAIFQGAEAMYDIDELCEVLPALPDCQARIYPPFGFLEVLDTQVTPSLSFDQFIQGVLHRNRDQRFLSNVTNTYTTTAGSTIRFVCNPASLIVSIDGVQEDHTHPRLTSGTILNSDGKGVITVENPALGKRLRLDMSDPENPRRFLETIGEVWVDFVYAGLTQRGTPEEPFSSLTQALPFVPVAGTVKLRAGRSSESIVIRDSMKLEAVGGSVRIGVQP